MTKRIDKYPIENLYVASTSKGKVLVCKMDEKRYKNLCFKTLDHDPNIYHVYEAKYLEIISDFKSLILKYELESLLLDKDGNEVSVISEPEAISIYRIMLKKSNFTQHQMLQLNHISLKVTNIICDLLGINISCNPNSGYNFADKTIHESVVPATKVSIFKKTLCNYIRAVIVHEKCLYISNCNNGMDYKISRSLAKAGIKVSEQMQKNIFSFSINQNGNVTVDGISLNVGQLGFQKTIKF